MMNQITEIDEVLVTAPRDHIAVLEEQELQITDKVKGENLESLTEDCIEVGLSLEQALNSEVNGVQSTKLP
jgi:predicted aldo/keto reductase-like oxidoreductase